MSVACNRRVIPAGAMEGIWQAPDGARIRLLDWPATAPRGSILFVSGRGDFYEKYLEALTHWHDQGWSVTTFDWRGQGGSGRLGNDPYTGHVDDFGMWIDDLRLFWRDWRARQAGPCCIVGHSMGGHLALRAAAEGAIDPAAIVLCAPMLGLRDANVPDPVMQGAAWLMCRLGDPCRPAWKWSEKPGQPPDSRSDLLTHDRARYEDELWWRAERPALVMGPGSWRWLERAYASMRWLSRRAVLARVDQPVLLLATDRDALVSFRASVRAAARLPHCELVNFGARARHEILREADVVRTEALARIDVFLAKAAA